jgi:6-phosphogluconolactonase
MAFHRTRAVPRPFLVLVVLQTGTACIATAATGDELVYVGTHGSPPPNASATAPPASDSLRQGIYQLKLDAKTGHLSTPVFALELQRATSLVTHPKLPIIYSVAQGQGAQTNSDVYSLKIDPLNGSLEVINKVDSGGRDATALALDERSDTLFAAHYGSGSLSALPTEPSGRLGTLASSQSETGSGPSPRQKSAHAHDVALPPAGNYALVTDLGADRIFVYQFERRTRSLVPAEIVAEVLPPGTGPRHLAFHPSGNFVLVNSEFTAELRSYRWDGNAGRLTVIQTLQSYPAGGGGDKSGGELAISKDGRFAYISLRGDQDSIVAYAIDQRHGTLSEIQRVPSQGKVPWSFGIDPSGHWMLITNEGSSSVTELKLDPASGRMTATGESVTVPKPVTVTFYAR